MKWIILAVVLAGLILTAAAGAGITVILIGFEQADL